MKRCAAHLRHGCSANSQVRSGPKNRRRTRTMDGRLAVEQDMYSMLAANPNVGDHQASVSMAVGVDRDAQPVIGVWPRRRRHDHWYGHR
jgi:hypothetical protein